GNELELLEAGIDEIRVFDGQASQTTTQLPSTPASPRFWLNEIQGRRFLSYAELPGPVEAVDFDLLDLTGRTVWQATPPQTAGRMLLPADLPAGIYVLRLNQGDKVLGYRKVMWD
ncbi:MAG: T9SS type A sorting domain-containing protein, partial [Bacteroidota bacterium]